MYTSASSSAIRFQTLVDALAAAPGEAPFVTMWNDEDDSEAVNFGEFRRRSGTVASQLRAKGIGAGDTVVLVMPQGVSLMASFAGAMMLGAVPAILAYPNFKVDPSKYRSGLLGVTRNLRARIVVIGKEFPEELIEHLAVDGNARLMREIDSCDSRAAGNWTPAAPEPRAIAFVQHSAGTTGLQKAVALSHAAVLRQLEHLSGVLQIRRGDCIYSWLPLYHDMGLIACFMLPLAFHLPVVMQSPDAWVIQPRTMLEIISRHRCTLAWVPNFTLQFLARRVRPEDRGGLDLSSIRALINCSEPIRARSLDEFAAAYKPHGFQPRALQTSYAMAENVFAVTQSNLDSPDGPARLWVDRARLRDGFVAVATSKTAASCVCLVSSGRCMPGNAVRIVASFGEDLPDGAIGEIVIRSDSLFDGYYNRADLSHAVLKDGWYWSGDLGFTWESELYVTGRKKDLIIVAGKNIYPLDVEEIVCSHPGLRDGRAVAFGLFNPELGTEDIVVVAELREEEARQGAASVEHAVRNALAAELGVTIRALYLKPPGWIVKSTAGKPARSATKEKLLAEHSELARTRTEV